MSVELIEERTAEFVAVAAALLPQVSVRAAPLTAEQVQRVVDEPSTRILLARSDGRPVGMALLLIRTTFAGRSGYLDEVVVDEAARGRGVGSALVAAVLSHASGLGLDHMGITSRPSRAAANRLYRSSGFGLRETNCDRFEVGRH